MSNVSVLSKYKILIQLEAFESKTYRHHMYTEIQLYSNKMFTVYCVLMFDMAVTKNGYASTHIYFLIISNCPLFLFFKATFNCFGPRCPDVTMMLIRIYCCIQCFVLTISYEFKFFIIQMFNIEKFFLKIQQIITLHDN